jgi:hypothetical protein
MFYSLKRKIELVAVRKGGDGGCCEIAMMIGIIE